MSVRVRNALILASVVVVGWLLVSHRTWAFRHPVEIALRMAEADLEDGLSALRSFHARNKRYPEDLAELARDGGWEAPEYTPSDCAFLGLIPIWNLETVRVVYYPLPASDSFAFGLGVFSDLEALPRGWLFHALTGPDGPVPLHPMDGKGLFPDQVRGWGRYAVYRL